MSPKFDSFFPFSPGSSPGVCGVVKQAAAGAGSGTKGAHRNWAARCEPMGAHPRGCHGHPSVSQQRGGPCLSDWWSRDPRLIPKGCRSRSRAGLGALGFRDL